MKNPVPSFKGLPDLSKTISSVTAGRVVAASFFTSNATTACCCCAGAGAVFGLAIACGDAKGVDEAVGASGGAAADASTVTKTANPNEAIPRTVAFFYLNQWIHVYSLFCLR